MMNMDRTAILGDTGTRVKDRSQGNLTGNNGSTITWTGNGKYSGAYVFSNNVNSTISIANT